jgi:hypothetical protein
MCLEHFQMENCMTATQYLHWCIISSKNAPIKQENYNLAILSSTLNYLLMKKLFYIPNVKIRNL